MIEIEKRIKRQEQLSTVGAVAIDAEGNICAGTSTGGLLVDLPGRVGDTPLIGCGTYANQYTKISCTGTGERIMQVVLAKKVADCIEAGMGAIAAAEKGVEVLGTVKGRGGLICIEKNGRIKYASNTRYITMAYIEGDQE